MELLERLDVSELAAARAEVPGLRIVDVREPWELELARLAGDDVVNLPMGELARLSADELQDELGPFETPLAVLCHHGVRSDRMAMWLRTLGFARVANIQGGIDAYAARVDPSVGTY